MKFNFILGNAESHEMEFSLDQFSGDLDILLDGSPVVKDFRMFAPDCVKRYELAVGNGEKHKVAFVVAYEGRDGTPAPASVMVTAIP